MTRRFRKPPPSVATLFGEAAKLAPKRFARGLRHKPGVMNKLEQSRADELDAMRARGEIIAYWFEAVTFKLADDTRYTPDFLVLYPDGSLVVEETKGHWQDDAKVKIKVAASMFPFPFVALRRLPKKDGGGWERTGFKGWTDGPLPPEAGDDPTADLADKIF